jgi:hypothetical protein
LTLFQSLSTNTLFSPSSFAIHADGDAVVGEDTGKGRTGELRASVVVIKTAKRRTSRCDLASR